MKALVADYVSFHRTPAETLQHLADKTDGELGYRCGPETARKAMQHVMRAYRTPDLVDPAAFVDAAMQAIEDFPAIVVGRLVNPKIGIIRECKFPPSIAELVAWCERDERQLRAPLETAKARVVEIERDRERAKQLEQARAQREVERAAWIAAAPQREREAERAGQILAERAVAEAEERQRRAREAEAQGAWMKAVFAVVKDEPDALERVYGLPEADQEKATKMELASVGSGARFVLNKISQEMRA